MESKQINRLTGAIILLAALVLILAAMAYGFAVGVNVGNREARADICRSVGGIPVEDLCVQPGAFALPPSPPGSIA